MASETPFNVTANVNGETGPFGLTSMAAEKPHNTHSHTLEPNTNTHTGCALSPYECERENAVLRYTGVMYDTALDCKFV